jgi:hypothetical protein
MMKSFKEEGVFLNKSIHLGPCRSTLFEFKDQLLIYMFSYQECFADEEMLKRILTFQTDHPTSIYKY